MDVYTSKCKSSMSMVRSPSHIFTYQYIVWHTAMYIYTVWYVWIHDTYIIIYTYDIHMIYICVEVIIQLQFLGNIQWYLKRWTRWTDGEASTFSTGLCFSSMMDATSTRAEWLRALAIFEGLKELGRSPKDHKKPLISAAKMAILNGKRKNVIRNH